MCETLGSIPSTLPLPKEKQPKQKTKKSQNIDPETDPHMKSSAKLIQGVRHSGTCLWSPNFEGKGK